MTSSRARRSVLPALAAAFAGALLAGATTVLSGPTIEWVADRTTSAAADTDTRSPDARGGLDGSISASPSSTPPSSTPATTSSTPPPTSSSTPPSSSPATTIPAPPPVTSSEEEPPPPPATPQPPPADTSQQAKVVSYVNAARQQRGCGPVSVDARLTSAAQNHSSDMSNRRYFSHTTPEGVTFDQRIRNAGYPKPGAENIARGAQSAEDVMRMWMESEGHRRNILNCDLSAIGVGLDTDGWYWTQNFGY